MNPSCAQACVLSQLIDHDHPIHEGDIRRGSEQTLWACMKQGWLTKENDGYLITSSGLAAFIAYSTSKM